MPYSPAIQTSKYLNRPGPPIPANDPKFRGKYAIGNNKKLYKSSANRKGICTWRLTTDKPPQKEIITHRRRRSSRSKSRSRSRSRSR